MAAEGRQARCICGKTVPSDPKLPFFEARGPGSRYSEEHCVECWYYEEAHTIPGRGWYGKHEFKPGRTHEYDSFYCGCRGWD